MSKRVNWAATGPEIKAYYDTEIAPYPERHQRFHDHYSSKVPNYYLSDTPDTVAEHTQATKRPGTSQGPQPVKVQAVEADSTQSSEGSVDPRQNVAASYSQANSQVSSSSANVPEDIEMGLPGTGMGTGGSGDGNANAAMPIYQQIQPHSSFGRKTSTYRKVHRFMTFAIAPTCISVDLTTPTENQRWWSTALAQIPWDLPVLYMNNSEFDLLPDGSYCKEVRLTVVHRGNRIAFETGEVATRLATLNQVQNIMVGFGLNKTGWGVNATYTAFTAGNPMLPPRS